MEDPEQEAPDRDEEPLAESVTELFGEQALCAHAEDDGEGMHWIELGNICNRPGAGGHERSKP